MPTFEAIIAVTIAGFVLSATPGPSMLYVLSRSVGQSRAAGLASAFGLALGGVLLAVATAMGLAAVFQRFDTLVVALRYAGLAYLVWLGIKMITGAREAAQYTLEAENVERTPLRKIIAEGVVVELLNPKTVLFFALFLPPFVNMQAGDSYSLQIQLLTLGALVPLTAIPSDLVVAFMGGTLASRLNDAHNFREVLAWVGGIILILIGLNLHFQFI